MTADAEVKTTMVHCTCTQRGTCHDTEAVPPAQCLSHGFNLKFKPSSDMTISEADLWQLCQPHAFRTDVAPFQYPYMYTESHDAECLVQMISVVWFSRSDPSTWLEHSSMTTSSFVNSSTCNEYIFVSKHAPCNTLTPTITHALYVLHNQVHDVHAHILAFCSNTPHTTAECDKYRPAV